MPQSYRDQLRSVKHAPAIGSIIPRSLIEDIAALDRLYAKRHPNRVSRWAHIACPECGGMEDHQTHECPDKFPYLFHKPCRQWFTASALWRHDCPALEVRV